MRVPLHWLRELAPTELPADDLAEILTARGVKVEGVIRPWEGLAGVVVTEVLEVRDHPGSDKLCLARIRHPEGEIELVVGVRNMAPGDLVPWAPPGARVPVLSDPLGAREIRGVVSHGMLCSPRELAISQEHEGILLLDRATWSVGDDLRSSLGLDDAVLDIEVEPNRPDFLSILGVARETAAATGAPLRMPEVGVREVDERAADVASVRTDAPSACPRYLARVLRGVGPGATPLLVQARLTAAGTRPISPVVDATNYVMLELGQPLHAFDLDRLAGPGIVVRTAEQGELITTLDGVERSLHADDLLICDVEGPVAIGGVMGGATSEVTPATSNVLLESAHFTRRGVLRSARRLDLHTEASYRFERGTDPEGLAPAAARCAALIAEWTGASVLASEVVDGQEPARRWVSMRPARAAALLGYPVSTEDARAVFTQLGFTHRVGDDHLDVEVPGYRVDIDREVDLIEEVVRVQGYDRVGSALPRAPHAGGTPEGYAFARAVKQLLVGSGLREIRPAPFVAAADLQLMGDDDVAIAVANPLRAEEGFLRTRLLPGLLNAVARNQALGVRSVAVFEVGAVFRRGDPFEERRMAGFALAGLAEEAWHSPARPFDVTDARGVCEALLDGVGVRWDLGDPPGAPLHPGRAATIRIEGRHAGVLGELHPRVAAQLDLTGRVAVGEFDLEVLRAGIDRDLVVRDVPRFPPVRRDLAFVVPAEVPAGEVHRALEEAAGPLMGEAVLFDVYEGDALPEGARSLAFAVDFRASDRTLTDEEAQHAVDAIVARLADRFDATLRTA